MGPPFAAIWQPNAQVLCQPDRGSGFGVKGRITVLQNQTSAHWSSMPCEGHGPTISIRNSGYCYLASVTCPCCQQTLAWSGRASLSRAEAARHGAELLARHDCGHDEQNSVGVYGRLSARRAAAKAGRSLPIVSLPGSRPIPTSVPAPLSPVFVRPSSSVPSASTIHH